MDISIISIGAEPLIVDASGENFRLLRHYNHMEFATSGREYWIGGTLFRKIQEWLNRKPARMSQQSQPEPGPESFQTTGRRRCCDEESCIRKDIADLLDPDAPITDRIYVAASAVARTCGSLKPEELQLCASRLFGLPAECDLAKAFRIAYQTERDALAGQRDIEARRAAKLA